MPEPRRPQPRWWLRLDVRLAAVVFVGLTATGAALLAWQAHGARTQQDALLQWQNLTLARYIADRQSVPFIDANGRARPDALASTAMYIGQIHPSLEAYLLDRQGRILQHSLGAQVPPGLSQVNLARVQPLLSSGPEPRLPVWGDDPRQPGQANLISVAALPDAHNVQGYLYLVLQGEQALARRTQINEAAQQGNAWAVTLLALALAGLVIVAAQWHITARLRRLASELADFRQPDGQQLLAARAGDDIAQVAQAAQALQARVHAQFQQLEDNDRLRRELLANISHDLHTPLANIQGYVETLLLQGEQLAPLQREQHLRTTLQHCRSLGRRVGELFELAHLDSTQALTQTDDFLIAELLNDVAQGQQLNAQQRGVRLCLAEDMDRQALVRADIRLIERVLQNLVDNALRHTPRGGLVELDVRRQAARVVVRVSDTGAGIAADDLPHIFERYWTTRSLPESQARPGSSAGLGLAIVRRILELHGSSIGVSSTPRVGTEFCFPLPSAV